MGFTLGFIFKGWVRPWVCLILKVVKDSNGPINRIVDSERDVWILSLYTLYSLLQIIAIYNVQRVCVRKGSSKEHRGAVWGVIWLRITIYFSENLLKTTHRSCDELGNEILARVLEPIQRCFAGVAKSWKRWATLVGVLLLLLQQADLNSFHKKPKARSVLTEVTTDQWFVWKQVTARVQINQLKLGDTLLDDVKYEGPGGSFSKSVPVRVWLCTVGFYSLNRTSVQQVLLT